MKKNLIFRLVVVGLFFTLNCKAQSTFKVMFYNLLNYPLEDAVADREDDLEYILLDYQPDLFLVCELNNITGANNILNITKTAISPNFEMATYVSNTSDDDFGDQNDLQNLLYYDTSKFNLEEEIIVPTGLRDFNIYKLLLNTVNQETEPVELYVVVCHLKASSGTDNAQKRFEMTQELNAYLNTLPSNTNVLLGGDLNLYTGSESAFQELLDNNNNIPFVDPENRVGSWHNNSSYVDVFTQSTRTQTGMGGTTGGFDDRFDFILTSQNMLGNTTINYVNDSYQVYGNNETTTCRNRRINSSDCDGPLFSFEVRDALHNFSDHLPVTVSLETDASLLTVEENLVSNKLLLKKTLISGELIIYVDTPQLFNRDLIIYNSIGQNVKTFTTNSSYRQAFNVSNLNSGLYFLAVPNSNLNPVKFVIAN